MKTEMQVRAVALRKQGRSVKQIESELGVARSSVSLWVRDVQLTEEQQLQLKKNTRANALASSSKAKEKAAQKREKLMKEGSDRAECDRDFSVICALYWGEGHKASRDVRLTNADPKMIDLFVIWLIKSNYNFSATIGYYEQNGFPYEQIEAHWLSEVPALKQGVFNKPQVCILNRASQQKRIGKLPYGTLTVRVKKSANLHSLIMGGIRGLRV